MAKTTELAGAAVGRGPDDPHTARAVLFERVIGRIHRYFWRLTRRADVAEELTQTALLELQRSLAEARYEPGRSFNAWMFLKAHSVWVGWCRRREREAREVPARTPDVADPAALAQRKLDAAAILEALGAQLGTETLECFVLRYEGELGLDQVAQATGCTRRTVSRRLARAHALIDELLGRAPAAGQGEVGAAPAPPEAPRDGSSEGDAAGTSSAEEAPAPPEAPRDGSSEGDAAGTSSAEEAP